MDRQEVVTHQVKTLMKKMPVDTKMKFGAKKKSEYVWLQFPGDKKWYQIFPIPEDEINKR